MITIDDFLKDLERTKDDMISELAVLNGRRDQLRIDIARLNLIIDKIKNTKE